MHTKVRFLYSDQMIGLFGTFTTTYKKSFACTNPPYRFVFKCQYLCQYVALKIKLRPCGTDYNLEPCNLTFYPNIEPCREPQKHLVSWHEGWYT